MATSSRAAKDGPMTHTLFDDEINEEFLVSVKNKPKPAYKRSYTASYFLINVSDLSNPKYKLFYCELNDNFVFLKENENSDHVAFMDILNAFVRVTNSTTIKGEKYFGLKFIKRQNFEELFTTDENVVLEWHDHLKRFCRQIKFRNYFREISMLGKGSFAKVFLVERKSDSQKFAVKIFEKEPFLRDEFERKCLMYEIKMMRAVNHPKLIRLFEIFEGEQFVYLLCDLFQGRDLWTEILEKGAQSEPKALTILQQLLEALVYLHSQKIIHRDIKPENVLFRSAKNITELGLVDLGFATYEKDYQKLFVRCGTPGYVAPEVLDDNPYDCKADVYSAGIVFYLTCPHQSHRPHALQRRGLRRNRPQKPGVRNRLGL